MTQFAIQIFNFNRSKATYWTISKVLTLVTRRIVLAVSCVSSCLLYSQEIRQSRFEDSPPLVPPVSLFTRFACEEIGMERFSNNYSSPALWGSRWQEYIQGSTGTGLAIGDVDGDGLPDVFIASKDETSRLFRNLGGFEFEDVTEKSGLIDGLDPAAGCAFADVDNDGDLDLYETYVGGKNRLWINDGNGKFVDKAEEWNVAVSDGCVMASFADYDNDGDLDFYLANNLIQNGRTAKPRADILFRNDGTRFTDVSKEAGVRGVGNVHAAIWWDFDADGWQDIYVAIDFFEKDRLYRNNRDGTFSEVLADYIPQIPYYSMGADFGDIDNDGREDFWVADMAPTTRDKYMRTLGSDGHTHTLLLGDEEAPHQYTKNVLLWNMGANLFSEVASMSGLDRTDWTWAARFNDLDNDGLLDAYVTNGMIRAFNDGDLSAKRKDYGSLQGMILVYKPEPVAKERNLAYRNLGTLSFEDRSEAWGLDHLGVSFGAAFADLDRDGDLDLLVNNFREFPAVYRNNDSLGNRITVKLRGVSSNSFGIGAKVMISTDKGNQMRTLQPMRGYMSSDEPIIHFGLGTEDQVNRLVVHWPSGIKQAFFDLEVNSEYTIMESSTRVELELPDEKSKQAMAFQPLELKISVGAERSETYFNDYFRQSLLPFPKSRLGGVVALGDVNNDGALDIAMGGSTGQSAALLLSKGAGEFESIAPLDLEDDFGSEDHGISFIDYDSDDDLDLLVVSGGIEMEGDDPFYADRVYENLGNGVFSRHWDAPISQIVRSSSFVSVELDSEEGSPRALVGYWGAPGRYPHGSGFSIWGRSGLVYAPGPDRADCLPGQGWVTDGAWADFDGDGDRDIVLSREWSSPEVFLFEGGRFEPAPKAFLSAFTGLWSSVEAADFNSDGLMDFAIGNLGLNTRYMASLTEPIRLWHASCESGDNRLIETFVENGVEWPLESKVRLESEFPEYLEAIGSFSEYASLSFRELFPDLGQRGWNYLEAVELRSGVFYQQSNGRFLFEPFPAFAQSGLVHDLIARDVDGDDDLDLVLSMEPLSPMPSSGRIEKGFLCLLRNLGGGEFEALRPGESGLMVQGSPRGLEWGDLDGDGREDLIVVVLEGMPLAFSVDAGR